MALNFNLMMRLPHLPFLHFIPQAKTLVLKLRLGTVSFSQKLISNKTEKFLQFMNKYENGFSLLEVAAALLILSTTVIILFQFILDTQVSTTSFQDKVIAREIANNRIALMDTIEPPLLMGSRTGNIRMYGKEWIWEEKTTSMSRDTTHFVLTVKLIENNETVFVREGYIGKK